MSISGLEPSKQYTLFCGATRLVNKLPSDFNGAAKSVFIPAATSRSGVTVYLVIAVILLSLGGVVYCFTILMPTLTIFIFRKINGFSPQDLTERKHRFVPFILTITSYVFCLLMMHRLNIPWYMTGIILASLIMMVICIVVNLRWKLSEHMAGSGAIIGGVVAFSALFGYNPLNWLCLFILIAGVLGTARIILQHHTLGEVIGGFVVGLVCSLLVLHPVSNILFRIFLF